MINFEHKVVYLQRKRTPVKVIHVTVPEGTSNIDTIRYAFAEEGLYLPDSFTDEEKDGKLFVRLD